MPDSQPGPQAAADDRLPLKDILVLDLTLARAGPTAVRHLADWGADVIRIEAPGQGLEDHTGHRHAADFQNLHRNKRAMTLDLKSPDGKAVFMRLAEKADVVIENMRVDVKHRLGVAYDDVVKINPRIVYGSISGYGQDGPSSAQPGVDPIMQGTAGLMSITGKPGEGPMRVGIAISDTSSGNMLALAVMMALFDRERTGRGRWVQTSLLESLIFMLDFQAARWLVDKKVPTQSGNEHATVAPATIFPTSDGVIGMGVAGNKAWLEFCDAMEHPEWKTKPEWIQQKGRSDDRNNLHGAVAAIIKTKPTAYWLDRMGKKGIPVGPVNTIDQVFADPQVQHLGLAAPVNHPILGPTHLVNTPLNFAGLKREIRSAAPEPGQHTDEILKWAGYSAPEIADLREKKAV